MAIASGVLSIFSSATEQNHALTVGFGVGAGFCSLVAGSIGFYDHLFARSLQEKKDTERGRESIELQTPKSIGSIHGTEVSVATGIEQRGLRALYASRQSPYAPYDPSTRPVTSRRGNVKRRQVGTQATASAAPLEDLKARLNSNQSTPRSAALLELAIDVVRAAEAVDTNRAAFRTLAREVSGLAHSVVDMCSEQAQEALQTFADENPTQAYMDTVIRLIEQARDLTASSAARKGCNTPWHMQEERDNIKAFVKNSGYTRRQSRASLQRQLVGTSPIPRLSTADGERSVALSSHRNPERGLVVEPLVYPFRLASRSSTYLVIRNTVRASKDDNTRERDIPPSILNGSKIVNQPTVPPGMEDGSLSTKPARPPPSRVASATSSGLETGAEPSNRDSTGMMSINEPSRVSLPGVRELFPEFPWTDPFADLDDEDDPTPLSESERIYRLSRHLGTRTSFGRAGGNTGGSHTDTNPWSPVLPPLSHYRPLSTGIPRHDLMESYDTTNSSRERSRESEQARSTYVARFSDDHSSRYGTRPTRSPSRGDHLASTTRSSRWSSFDKSRRDSPAVFDSQSSSILDIARTITSNDDALSLFSHTPGISSADLDAEMVTDTSEVYSPPNPPSIPPPGLGSTLFDSEDPPDVSPLPRSPALPTFTEFASPLDTHDEVNSAAAPRLKRSPSPISPIEFAPYLPLPPSSRFRGDNQDI
ncbi:hypothetical protein PQX77_006532, partial [Marasmius sp. AFHP31]